MRKLPSLWVDGITQSLLISCGNTVQEFFQRLLRMFELLGNGRGRVVTQAVVVARVADVGCELGIGAEVYSRSARRPSRSCLRRASTVALCEKE
jgi:hypothetical protein